MSATSAGVARSLWPRLGSKVSLGRKVSTVTFAIVLSWAVAGTVGAQGLDTFALSSLEESGKVDPVVLDDLQRYDRAEVFVGLDVAEAAGLRRGVPLGLELRRSLVPMTTDSVLAAVSRSHVRERSRFHGVAAFGASIDVEGALALARNPMVWRIGPDSGGGAALVETRAVVRATEVHDLGFNGSGAVVGILDSGYDGDHIDLFSSLDDEACFCDDDCCPDRTDSQVGSGAADDAHGHGSHVAGIITSDGSLAPPGIAPQSAIVAVRVLDHRAVFNTMDNIINGLEWIRDNRPDVTVVNMSLGTSRRDSGTCDLRYFTLAEAADDLRDRGVLLVAASGNNGDTNGMSAPGCISDVVSVGATWDADVGAQDIPGVCEDLTTQQDQVACYANSGSRTDLFAPGGVVRSSWRGGVTVELNGTSMASAVVSGCASLLFELAPDASPGDIEEAMEASPVTITVPDSGRVFGRLDCADAAARLLPPALCGDASNDGVVVADDALAALRAAVNKDGSCPLARCDINGDGLVQASDALGILRLAVGLAVALNCPVG